LSSTRDDSLKPFRNELESCAASVRETVSRLAAFVECCSIRKLHQQITSHYIRVTNRMNTKLTLAALVVALSLAACAKKEEPAEAAQDAAAAAGEAATDAAASAGEAASAAGDAAAAAGDAAAGAATPPAPPAEPAK
jgi:hypothetical protein